MALVRWSRQAGSAGSQPWSWLPSPRSRCGRFAVIGARHGPRPIWWCVCWTWAKETRSCSTRPAAIVISHDQSDHAGDLGDLLGSIRVGRLVYGRADPRLRRAALAVGAEPFQLAEGGEIDSGALHLSALWPPRELLGETGEDPNLLCLVLVARWRHFTMLLTGDAEVESVPMDPGPIDVLKVSHHGSADAGLPGLLERSVPKLAVISVGADNPYGHPTAQTVAELRSHGVPTMRTDREGEIDIDAG